MSDVLYGAAVVQQWSAQQCVCAITVGVAIVGVTCALNGASNRAWLSVGALSCPVILSRNTQSDVCGIKRDGVAAGAKANVTQ